MKKLTLLLITMWCILVTTISCDFISKLEPKRPPKPPKAQKSISISSAKDEFLMDEVRFGLHKIQINDSTTVLIYRGTESCTMIQLK
jgi:hypothetical protein